MTKHGWGRVGRLAFGFVATLCVTACTGNVQVGPEAIKGKRPSGWVEMHEVQAAYIGSGSAGAGRLTFRGRSYPFTVGGLGIGGIGLSTIEAEGEVYDLEDLYQFPGAYGEARYGFALGSASAGDLWLQNRAGVIMHLKAKRTGLMLSLGGDGILISMDR
jgi:hypothetical protein